MPKTRPKSSFSEGHQPPYTTQKSTTSPDAAAQHTRLRLDAAGRIVVPASMRKEMGIQPGEILSARVVDGELRLLSREAAVRRAQKLVRSYIPEGTRLVDELIAERRREEARESDR